MEHTQQNGVAGTSADDHDRPAKAYLEEDLRAMAAGILPLPDSDTDTYSEDEDINLETDSDDSDFFDDDDEDDVPLPPYDSPPPYSRDPLPAELPVFSQTQFLHPPLPLPPYTEEPPTTRPTAEEAGRGRRRRRAAPFSWPRPGLPAQFLRLRRERNRAGGEPGTDRTPLETLLEHCSGLVHRLR